MESWKKLLKENPIDWLLEENDPSIRYFAMKDILDMPEDDISVRNQKQKLNQSSLINEILLEQQQADYIKSYPKYYTDKYKGLVWTLIVLSELGAAINPQIKEQCEYILNHSQEMNDGGFSQHNAERSIGGRKSEVIPCLTGNMVWCLIRFGYIDDPRLIKGINWITKFMCFNDGIETHPQVSPYNSIEMCWGSHTCHMGVVKTLKALSCIPDDKKDKAVTQTICQAVEFLLIHHIYKRSHNLEKISKPGWKKFGFPLMYQTDILEILDILTSLGIKDERMEDAINIVIEKQDKLGRWKMENTYGSDRLLIPMGNKDEPSKWITLRAVRILKNFFG